MITDALFGLLVVRVMWKPMVLESRDVHIVVYGFQSSKFVPSMCVYLELE